MYIIQNAIKNIGRNKGRNILMAIIIFAIILTTAVSIIINTTTANIIDDYRNRFGSEVTIGYDYSNMSSSSSYEALTAQQVLSFAESDYLKSTVITQEMSITFDELRALDDDKEGLQMGGSITNSGDPKENGYLKILGRLCASNIANISDDFENGLRELVEGTMYSKEGECLVSQQFAQLNNLTVGDTVVVKNYTDGSMAYTLTICGIYADYTMLQEDLGMYSWMPCAQFNRNNEILIGFETARNMELMQAPMMSTVEATYYLKDPAMLEAYEKELREKGLPDSYKVSTDEASYNRIVGPVEGMSKITNTFLIVVLVLGCAILILLSTLAIRERKYEIGVLRAMGMKKGKVAMGILCEMLVITCICLVIGLGVGSIVSQPVADVLLEDQIEAIESSNASGTVNGMPMVQLTPNGSTAGGTEETTLSELEVHLTMDAVIKISLVALGLACISSLVGIAYITKFEPMKILSERS